VFWLLAKDDILYPETGEYIPATLVIRPGTDARGRPIQSWERTFHFPRRRRRFRSIMRIDAATGMVAECEGPRNAIEELTATRFHAPATIEITSVRSWFVVGRWRVRIPRRLWVTARVVQEVLDEAAGTSHISLIVTHGLLGPVFGYEGTFRSVRRPRRRAANG
jgi:hypothetical protein